MIRLGALRTFCKLIERWCYRLAFPVLILVGWSYAWSMHEKETTWHYLLLLAPPIVIALAMLLQSYEYSTEEEDTTTGITATRRSSSLSKAKKDPSSVFITTTTTEEESATAVVRRRSRRRSTDSSLVEMPTDVLVAISLFLHPRDVTVLSCINKSASQQFASSSSSNQIWKQLWYRDYGHVLLNWQVGREVLAQSLGWDKENSTTSLEDCLSHHLDQKSSLKEFYFVFGEIYTNYLVARRNSATNCYFGLHGHILDFTDFAEYHPGLAMDEVLLECGQDATTYFEQLPHSRGARALATVLVVLVNQGTLLDHNNNNNSECCGFALRAPPDNLQQLLRISNSRPVTLRDCNMVERGLFPQKARTARQLPPTLARIRRDWDAQLVKQQAQLQRQQLSVNKFWQSPSTVRVYYDPLQQQWITWDAAKTMVAR